MVHLNVWFASVTNVHPINLNRRAYMECSTKRRLANEVHLPNPMIRHHTICNKRNKRKRKFNFSGIRNVYDEKCLNDSAMIIKILLIFISVKLHFYFLAERRQISLNNLTTISMCSWRFLHDAAKVSEVAYSKYHNLFFIRLLNLWGFFSRSKWNLTQIAASWNYTINF